MSKLDRNSLLRLVALGAMTAMFTLAGCMAEVPPDEPEGEVSQDVALLEARSGFAWINTPADGVLRECGPAPFCSHRWYNSAGGNVSFQRVAKGQYQVKFLGLGGGGGGNVQVVSAFAYDTRCKVQSWWAMSGPDVTVNVACHDPAGPQDTQLVVRYGAASGGDDREGAYLWANDSTASSYTPSATYSWNSRGQTNQVTRQGVGEYTAILPGHTTTGGSVEVTAYGSDSAYCKIVNWSSNSAGTRVRVRCFTGAGALTNSRFSLNYLAPKEVGLHDYGAYAWANQETASTYTPYATYSYNSGTGYQGCDDHLGSTSAGRYMPNVGDYYVRHTRLDSREAVPHVTAYGSDNTYCVIESWYRDYDDPTGGTNVRVRCFDPAGNHKNSKFVETFTSSRRRGPC